MRNLVWESVDVKQFDRRRGEAYASIGQGRIALNAKACSLISNIYDYKRVKVVQAKDGNKVVMIGLKFTNDQGDGTLNVVRRKYKGKEVEGIDINSKALIKKYFGETKETSTSRHKVKKINSNTIGIDILNEL